MHMEELFQLTLMGHILEKPHTIMDIIQIWVAGEEEEEGEARDSMISDQEKEGEAQDSMISDQEEAEVETMMIMVQEEDLEIDGTTMIITEDQIEEVLGMMEEGQTEEIGGTEEPQLTGTEGMTEVMTEETQYTEEIGVMTEIL
jgi:hypothetical protein